MARAPALAAGGIVVRDGPRPLIALVQRRKDNDWVLPKGKPKGMESAVAAARREVIEETAHNVLVHEFLGVISYKAGRKPKLAQFWRMQAVADSGRKPTRDVRAVQWLPLESAIQRLSLPREAAFLRNVGPRALKRAKPSGRPLRIVGDEQPARPRPSVPSEPIAPGAPAIAAAPSAPKGFFQRIFGVFAARREEARGAE